jgi:hypothetical protein
MTDRRNERDRARRERRKAREATSAAEKRGTAGSMSWWKRGAAITPARMRKKGRFDHHEGGCSFGHSLTSCTRDSTTSEGGMTWKYSRR